MRDNVCIGGECGGPAVDIYTRDGVLFIRAYERLGGDTLFEVRASEQEARWLRGVIDTRQALIEVAELRAKADAIEARLRTAGEE